jgi:hypothetical protein
LSGNTATSSATSVKAGKKTVGVKASGSTSATAGKQ